MHKRVHRCHQDGDQQYQHDGTHEVAHAFRLCGLHPTRRLRVAPWATRSRW
ncbi:hypothetical protein TBKG_01342 [Mycobacterium tuberculosis '98-R604 INH-RIF-EM']|uniref:Uncharacterized protein n=1 Tax=Mycobacterium tuberculosis (strain CDC 1551 / Oshkosh) TaxID=83331 RepID=Q8VKK7_MYCTO|nr:hypothetical protein MT0494 [Mycobacterium tuberculosis CDC1551]EFD45798.1 conserved hypothetical protein [Mycobacterium tuberculosis T17]EFD52191.1 conserved hypothetical protein [Mycobacterium tuberculosis 02_1987]EPZ63380.1 hypothetical protein TBKG_01342 [Mycobacterium tuberculosis '98-R604 INH-RIF-EM']